jgi:endonuclease G, mitochondrial
MRLSLRWHQLPKAVMKKNIACRLLYLVIFFLAPGIIYSQSIESKLAGLDLQLDSIAKAQAIITEKIENLKLERIRRDLLAAGLPSNEKQSNIVWHAAYVLEYDEAFEQARWVAHIITPDVLSGIVSRTNDFRPDSLIRSGSAVEADYFLKQLQPDSTYKYDAFGYDRGHLAPSADFRWSAKALSESYLYSNMSPQLGAFNREAWASVEDKVRGYLYSNPSSQLYVVTGPVLKEGLPKIERGVNKVSIPEFYWKVAIDPVKKKGIGFIMPNRKITQAVEGFAVTIDSVERYTGYDFFSNLPAAIQNDAESQRELADWFPLIAKGDVEPVKATDLKRGQINTEIAAQWINSSQEITVTGTVVSGRASKSGNILLNLDKQFPNQVFTVFIKKENIPNFSYDILTHLKGKRVFVTGKVSGMDGMPVMYVDYEKQVLVQ